MEKNLTKKEERIREKEKLSNAVTNKMIIVFLALVFSTVLLLNISSTGAREIGFVMALPYIQIGFGVLTAAALVWYIVCKRRGVDERLRVFSSPLLLGLAASGLFASLLYTGLGGVFRTVLALLAFTLLFFVYQIFAVDFFLCSLSVVACCLAATIVRSAGFGYWHIPVSVAAVLVAVAATVLCVYVTSRLHREGKMELCGKKLKRPLRMVPTAIYAASAAALLAVAASAIFGYLLYCIAAVAVVYLIVAIIYTVKLM